MITVDQVLDLANEEISKTSSAHVQSSQIYGLAEALVNVFNAELAKLRAELEATYQRRPEDGSRFVTVYDQDD